MEYSVELNDVPLEKTVVEGVDSIFEDDEVNSVDFWKSTEVSPVTDEDTK